MSFSLFEFYNFQYENVLSHFDYGCFYDEWLLLIVFIAQHNFQVFIH